MGVLPAWYTQAHSRGAINPCLYSRSCLAHSIEVTSYRFRSLAAQARSYSWASLPHRHTASNTVCDLMWGCTYVTDTWAIACFTVKEPDSLSLHALVPVHSPLRSSFCPRQMNKYPIQIPFLSFNQGGNHFCRKKKKVWGVGDSFVHPISLHQGSQTRRHLASGPPRMWRSSSHIFFSISLFISYWSPSFFSWGTPCGHHA